MTVSIGWELYRTFLCVFDEGSLSGASRVLDMSQPTVGRHVSTLESQLKQVLFTRSQSGFRATQAARALEPHARAMACAAAALQRAAHGDMFGVVGTVRVTASEIMGIEVLPPIVARLQDAHPELRVELSLSDRVQNLLERESDIGVRGFRPKQEQLIVQQAGTVELGLHASQRYLNRHGIPLNLADLGSHRLIGFDEDRPYLREARKQFPAWERHAFSTCSDSDRAQLAMLCADGGIGICQQPLAHAHRLTRVLPEVTLGMPLWLAMHSDLRTSQSCRITFEALAAGISSYCGAK